MKAMVLLGAFFALGASSAAAFGSTVGPTLKLVDGDGVIYVLLSNHGDQSVKLRKDFLLDALAGSLSFRIVKENIDFPLSATINPVLPTESAYVVLPPGAVTGRVVGHWQLAHMYGMRAGCYQVSATYHDRMAGKFAALGDELDAPAVRLCISDDESGIPLTDKQAADLARNALHGIGGIGHAWSVAGSRGDGDFYRFSVQPSNEVVSEVFVGKRTGEVWLSIEKKCTRYEKPGLAAAYAPEGNPPSACNASP